jgi:molybdopterin-guanine dinucleotide biosynthesis protein A
MIHGYVLAGGESSRMQQKNLPRDKAFLEFEGTTLLARAVAVLSPVCDCVSILCGTDERRARMERFGRCVPDRRPGCGPVGGLEAALHDGCDAEHVVLLPVDQPFMTSDLLRLLVEKASDATALVACFRTSEHIQPLPVVVSTLLREKIAEAVATGERKLMPVLTRAAGERLHVVQSAMDRAFTNLNTPAEYMSTREPGGTSSDAAAS